MNHIFNALTIKEMSGPGVSKWIKNYLIFGVFQDFLSDTGPKVKVRTSGMSVLPNICELTHIGDAFYVSKSCIYMCNCLCAKGSVKSFSQISLQTLGWMKLASNGGILHGSLQALHVLFVTPLGPATWRSRKQTSIGARMLSGKQPITWVRRWTSRFKCEIEHKLCFERRLADYLPALG